MKRFALILLAALMLTGCACGCAEDGIYIRQVNDHCFVDGTMIDAEVYPEIRLVSVDPSYVGKLAAGINTVCIPLPEYAVPDEITHESALLLDARNQDCKITYEYTLLRRTTVREAMNDAPSHRIALLNTTLKGAYINMKGAHSVGLLYLNDVNATLKITYRVVDWDAYPDEQMKQVLKDGILAEMDRVEAAVTYSQSTAKDWWSTGKFAGISMLDGDNCNFRVTMDFPEFTIADAEGNPMTGRMYPYSVRHNKVKGYVYFSDESGFDLEITITSFAQGAIKKLEDGSPDAFEADLGDGNTWAVCMSDFSGSQETTLITAGRLLHRTGGSKKNEPAYLTISLNSCGRDRVRFRSRDEAVAALTPLVSTIVAASSPNEP